MTTTDAARSTAADADADADVEKTPGLPAPTLPLPSRQQSGIESRYPHHLGNNARSDDLESGGNDNDDDNDAASVGHQRLALSKHRLLVAFCTLAVTSFVSYVDQTSVSTSTPAISAELNTGSATSWIGASFLIASTSFQLVNGRLSDIFGRKHLLLACLTLLALGDLLAGFSKTKEQLFAFRAIAGIGGGGVNSLTLVIASDLTTIEQRGKYMSILGASLTAANGAGPFLGGALVQKASWRWVFFLVPMMAVPAAVVILLCLPLRHDSGGYAAKARKIDVGGIVLNLAAVLLVLIPLSGGGITYAWSSAQFISMFVVGAILTAAFILYEGVVERITGGRSIPIMPLPIYFQSVMGFSALESGALMLPLIVSSSTFSVLSGGYMSRKKRYLPLIVAGYCLWIIMAGIKCTFDQSTPLWKIIVILTFEGFSVGLTLQPTLVALLVNSRPEDRAVLTGLRNFLRTVGGGFGLVISGAILSNTLRSKLSGLPYMTDGVIRDLTSSTYALDKLGLTDAQKQQVLSTYMLGIHYIFIFYVCSAGAMLLLTAGIGNTRLGKPKEGASGDCQGPEAQVIPHRPPEAGESAPASTPGHTAAAAEEAGK